MGRIEKFAFMSNFYLLIPNWVKILVCETKWRVVQAQ